MDPLYQALADQLFHQYEINGTVNPAAIINQYEEADQQEQAASILQTTLQLEPSPEDNSMVITEIVRKVKEESLQHQLTHLQDYNKLQDIIRQKGQISDWNISLTCG